MPRSPRATITQSAALMMSTACSTACGFSIFAISGRRVWSRTDSTSSGDCTNDSATMSTPIDSPWREQMQVLLGHRRQRRDRTGDVQPLARGDRASDLDLDLDLAVGGAHRDDAQPYRAVGEIQDRVALDGVRQPAPGDAHVVGVAGELLLSARERQLLARRQLDDVLAQRPDPQLRARADPAGSRPGARRGRRPRARG